VRQHDPSKQRVNGLSPNVSLVFQGELHKYTNAVYSCVFDAIMGRGDYGDVSHTEELRILVSSDVCIQLMSAHWVDLFWFGTQPKDKHVMSKKSAGIIVNREDWESWTVDEVEAAWFNARTLYDRLFSFTPVMMTTWDKMWSDLQRLKLTQSEYYSLLKYGWVQYEILYEAGANFFGTITRPTVTKSEVEEAVRQLCIDPDNAQFNKSYTAKERFWASRYPVGGKHPRDVGVVGEPTLTKKQRKAAAAAAKATNGGGHGGGVRPKGLCFSYLSTAGCTMAGCHFRHESASGLPVADVAKIKAGLVSRNLVADPTKF
jgi:hypothetical protein